ncbi:hypothetical protein [Nodularia sphaerocarpa]|uniref:hypothetical protein n=1 Tax=Nodularia sphaerocarpa TaxID=137816 RepID=UPI001EFBCBF4|nr:hypothetical protein [Nodularia sphaerocarpa]MDB9373104.1 hypothetical protein [Nodularia sphaerocarpa CS-585]ULP73234.1 hypothetical protein BDGGKGIB_02887 [Nodularia sphaerocarpa UHCC 0038]
MSNQIIESDFFEELSAEQQQLLSGGQNQFGMMGEFEDEPEQSDCPKDTDEPDSEGTVRRIPIRLTGILEVVK